MKTIGDTIREIRKNKRIKQEDMKSVSQSSLSAIEKGRIPSIELFINILKELDIEMLEFFYIQNNFKLPERDHLFKLFREQKSSLDVEYMKMLQDTYDEYLTNTDDPFIRSLRDVLDVYREINVRQSFKITHQEAYDKWNEIANRKVWYHNDIYMLTKIFYIFPVDQIDNVIGKAVRQLEKYNNYPHIHFFKIAFFINCSRHYILEGQYLKSKPHLIAAERLANDHQEVTLRLASHFLLAYSDYIEGEHEQAQERVDRTTSIYLSLESLELKDKNKNDIPRYGRIAKDHLRDWENFLAEQNKSK
ncbi:helix-turn-helix domain-containing protein [Paenilisteria rocourtiae]|uniref:Helix-turn-helix protein n=1 Tax=Listeria rocourtiae TaxID=647910 RepID=A0A4R6ZNC9_9LIST|nr:helix-turn-helix transcriptional regulator [Listeria rocourtiae]EUJ51564.1 putative transcriptional regulator [Listeria rocourtiae FSL F6-920]TDR53684.1 helix-turn-helix protein [Listeria rocourtiae]